MRLLELGSGFDNLFGDKRGVQADAAAKRDQAQTQEDAYRAVPESDISHQLCDPARAQEGQIFLDGCSRVRAHILKSLAEGDFRPYLKETAQDTLAAHPLLSQAIACSHDFQRSTVGRTCNTYDKAMEALGIIPLINRDEIKALTEDKFAAFVLDKLAIGPSAEFTENDLQKFFTESYGTGKFEEGETPLRDLATKTSVKYNERNAVHGRYFTQEQWNGIWAMWPAWHADGTADITLLENALAIHGAKDSNKRGQYSRQSKRNLAKYNKLQKELARLQGRRRTITMTMNDGDASRKSHMSAINRDIDGVIAKLKKQEAQILPASVHKASRS